MPRWVAVVISIIMLGILIGGIIAVKGMQFAFMMDSGASFAQPPETVSVTDVEYQTWPENLTAVGALAAWQGLTVSAEISGRVSAIHFDSGDEVTAGQLLVEQESGTEQARLRAAKAKRELAKRNLTRLNALKQQQSVSQSNIDEAQQQLEAAESEVEDLQVTLAKKRIVAPFGGRLGIRQVYLGQDIQVSDPIVSLQSIDQLRVNFTLPQHWFDRIRPGYKVQVFTKQGVNASGNVLATAAEIDPSTRNLHVQAKIDNADHKLLPGMSVGLLVELPNPRDVLAIPNTAVLYAPYGDTVFIVEPGENGGPDTVRQQFVRLGEARGDFVAVEAGLEAGQRVVSAGAFKLFNGMAVKETDNPEPVRSLDPKPADS